MPRRAPSASCLPRASRPTACTGRIARRTRRARSRSSSRALRSLGRMLGRVAVVALALGVAACSSKPKPVVVQAPPAPPSGIEGRYRGTARLVQSNNRFCPRSGPRVYELQNGQIELSYQGPGRTRVPLTAPIQPDGTFDVSDGQGRLQGRVANGTLETTIASQYCEHHYTMRPV